MRVKRPVYIRSTRQVEVIDSDALDQVFATTPTDGRMVGQVTFSYREYKVTVCSDGYVSVVEPDE